MSLFLNVIAVEYALKSMQEYIFVGRVYLNLWHHYLAMNWRYNPILLLKKKKCEAQMRTQGLSRAYVVASCTMDTRNTVYSDYSGKKQRQTLLKDFPFRRADFNMWYRGVSKPYQHIDLYNRMNGRLGKIGSIANGVEHPIGYCAEQNVANRLLLDGEAPIDDIKFSLAIRPRTGEIVDYCNNCKTLFGGL